MIRFAGVVFAVAALAGPLIRYATWPPSWFEKVTSTRAEGFVYDLVFYLWPAQPLAVVEASVDRPTTVVLAVGGNVLLFILVGLVVGSTAGRPRAGPMAYAAACGLLLLFALWGAGFSPEQLDWFPLIVAIVLYAIPFWLVAAAATRRAR